MYKVIPPLWRDGDPGVIATRASAIRELNTLMARIEALEADLQRKKNRLEKTTFNTTSSVVMESLHKMIVELDAERARLEKTINNHIDRHPDLKNDLH